MAGRDGRLTRGSGGWDGGREEGESGEARQQLIVVGRSIESQEELLFFEGEDDSPVVAIGASEAGGGLETSEGAGDGIC